jgi:hypothetical protein
MPDHTSNGLSEAVLQTLVYSDVFDFPLSSHEVHRYLTERIASHEEVVQALTMDSRFVKTGEYFTLVGRENIVNIRKQREIMSHNLMPYALSYGRILGSLPFARMVALTGSLAVMNISKNADFDYLLVTVPGRVWTARAFALLFNRFTRLFGNSICPNLIVSESALEWPLHDLYSARELCQMIPITGMDVYHRMMEANGWVKEFLPNATPSLRATRSLTKQSPSPFLELLCSSLRSLLAMTEWILRGKFGDRFERWEMDRKVARFSKQEGFGEETVFTADVCQGNFHHHRKWTREVYENKLLALAAVPGGELQVSSSPRTEMEAYTS